MHLHPAHSPMVRVNWKAADFCGPPASLGKASPWRCRRASGDGEGSHVEAIMSTPPLRPCSIRLKEQIPPSR